MIAGQASWGARPCVIRRRSTLTRASTNAWLDPDPQNPAAITAILDDPIDAYYRHEVVEKEVEVAG